MEIAYVYDTVLNFHDGTGPLKCAMAGIARSTYVLGVYVVNVQRNLQRAHAASYAYDEFLTPDPRDKPDHTTLN